MQQQQQQQQQREHEEGKTEITVIGRCVPRAVLPRRQEMCLVIGPATSAPITDTCFLFVSESCSQDNSKKASTQHAWGMTFALIAVLQHEGVPTSNAIKAQSYHYVTRM